MDRLRIIQAKKHSKNLNDDKAFDKMQSDYEDEVNLAKNGYHRSRLLFIDA